MDHRPHTHDPQGGAAKRGKGQAKTHRVGRHPNSLAALRPVAKGEIRNPLGLNGTTYRDSFDQEIDRLLAVKDEVQRDRTRGQLLAEKVLKAAESGERHAISLVMKRVWPEVHHLKVTPDAPPHRLDLSMLEDDDLRTMDRIHAKVRAGNEIEVQGEHVIGSAEAVVVVIDDEKERHG